MRKTALIFLAAVAVAGCNIRGGSPEILPTASIPSAKLHNGPGWYEVPAMQQKTIKGGYTVNAKDPGLYYVTHSFTMAGREYRNYTACFSAEHHSPMWVAAPRHRVYTRAGTRRSNVFGPDPLLPRDIQYRSNRAGSDAAHWKSSV